jgi:hypothetical protein
LCSGKRHLGGQIQETKVHIYKQTFFEDNPVSIHRLGRTEIVGDQVIVGLHSQADETLSSPSFYRGLVMPLSAFTAAPYPQCVTDWLIAPGGKLAGGIVVTGAEAPLQVKQAQLLAKVEEVRDEHIHGGMTVGEDVYDTDAASIRNLTGKAQRANLALTRGDLEWTTPFKLMDNRVVTLTIDGMLDVGEALDNHISGCYGRSWQLKYQIATATAETIGAVEAELLVGWPA